VKFAHFSHVWNRPDTTPAQRYELLWRELALADDLGFDFGFAVEHHFSPHESWMPAPAIYCTGAAAHTRRMRIGPMGYVAPLYDPLRIVEEAAVLDQVLDGRLELGLVSGIQPAFFGPYRADFDHRRSLTHEAVEVLQAAFQADGSFTFAGPHHQYEDVTLSVKAVQQPHPPMWVQSRDPHTLSFLAQRGVNTGYLFFMPRHEVAPRYVEYLRQWDQAGHQRRPDIGYWTLVYVDDTDEQAVETARPHVLHAFTKVFGFGDTGGLHYSRLAENYERRGELGAAEIARHVTDVDYLVSRNLVFIGAPETVARQIQGAATDGLFNTVFCEFNFGYLPEPTVRRSMQRFAAEVMPALRSLEPLDLARADSRQP
jgi:alkanesulfonate monooxygenase SsuD/methylene tetrahydromethanopterin reductase-like flavin-dependent oxidoreductase (luciferase family)